MDWINLVHDCNRRRDLVNTAMDLRATWNAGNFLTSWGTFSFSCFDYLRTIFCRLQDYKSNRWTLSSNPVQYMLVKTTDPLPPGLKSYPEQWSYLRIYCCLDRREITSLQRTPKFITVVTKARNWTVASANHIQSPVRNPTQIPF